LLQNKFSMLAATRFDMAREVLVGVFVRGLPDDPKIAAEIGQHGEERPLRTTVDVTLS
jgi:hypothetical protein